MNRTLACPTDESLKNLLKGSLTGPLVELLATHLENCANCTRRAEQFRMEDDYATLLRKEQERQLTAPEAQELAELRSRMLSLKETLTNTANPTVVNPRPNRETPRELRAQPAPHDAATFIQPAGARATPGQQSRRLLWGTVAIGAVAVAAYFLFR